MRRVAPIVLLLSYAVLGTGALEFLHNLQHAAEDEVPIKLPLDSGSRSHHVPAHDESNCSVHAQLHIATLAVNWSLPVLCVGLLIALLAVLLPDLPSQGTPVVAFCRSPPVC